MVSMSTMLLSNNENKHASKSREASLHNGLLAYWQM